VRGLKLSNRPPRSEAATVAPRVGAWIETSATLLGWAEDVVSHPAWVRGLKPLGTELIINGQGVAPRVGAWIETPYRYSLPPLQIRRTPRGCVD